VEPTHVTKRPSGQLKISAASAVEMASFLCSSVSALLAFKLLTKRRKVRQLSKILMAFLIFLAITYLFKVIGIIGSSRVATAVFYDRTRGTQVQTTEDELNQSLRE
jgi:hypothetical protein